MIILGIDPGIAIMGWSVIGKENNAVSLRGFGAIETAAGGTLAERLVSVSDQLESLFETHRPDVLALETLFFVKNAKTLAHVGHARGVVLLSAGRRKIPVFEYAPKQIKLALTGYGSAEKRQMQLVVQRMLNLKSIPRPDDAADAVAVGLCHSQYAHFNPRLAATA